MSFDQFLDALLSEDNAKRKAAEAVFQSAKANPAELIANLVGSITSDANVAHRSLCAVMLRKLVERTAKIWASLPDAQKKAIQDGSLKAFLTEPVKDVRNKVSHLVAELAVQSAGEGGREWPALLPAVMQLATSQDAGARETALFMFTQLAEYSGDELLGAHAASLLHVLGNLLKDPVTSVAVAALKGAAATIVALGDDADRASYQALVPQMLKVLESALSNREDEDPAKEVLKALVEVITHQPQFMRAFLEPACGAMLQIVNHDGFEDETRILGLEFLQALAENAGATVRKFPALVEHILSLCLRFLSSTEDDDEWQTRDDDPLSFIGDEAESEASDLLMAGAETSDRLAKAIGGKTLVPLFMSHWGRMTSSGDWKQKRAVLLALALIQDGCKKQMAPTVRQMVQSVVPFLSDPHPRVRHAALRCLGQMAADFSDPNDLSGEYESIGQVADSIIAQSKSGAGATAAAGGASMARAKGENKAVKSIQEAANDILLPALITAAGAQNAAAPRNRGLACGALVNLLDPSFCDADDIGNNKEALLTALFGVLSEVPASFTHTRGHALQAITCAATVLEDSFAPFYSSVMPPLKAAITGSTGDEQRGVRCKALDCLSAVCEAVGKEVSGMDAAECLNFILRAQAAGVDDDTETFKFFSSALVRLASTLGADFAPYYGPAFSILVTKASQEVKVVITDASEGDTGADSGDADEGENRGITEQTVDIKGVGKRKIALDSNAISDKTTAVTALTQIVNDLGVEVTSFWPLIDTFARVLCGGPAESKPAVSDQFPAIREIAAQAVVPLLKAGLADRTDASHGQRILDGMVPHLIHQLKHERNLEVLYTLGEATCEAFKLAWASTTLEYNGPDGAADAAAASAPQGSPAGSPSKAGGHKYSPAIIPLACLPALFEAIQDVYENSAARRQAMAEETNRNPDADEVDAENLAVALNDEDDLITSMTDTLGYCIKTHKAAVLPALSQGFGNYMLGWLAKREDVHIPMRCASICMLDDLFEHASPQSHVLAPQYYPHLLEGILHPNTIMRQPCAYGVGVCAQFAGDSFSQHIPDALKRLGQIISAPGARDGDMEMATDNAVSSIIKIAKFRPQNVDAQALMSSVVPYLPFKADGIEARLVHGWLVAGLATSDPLWIGAGGSRIPALLTALAKGLYQHKKNTEANEHAADEDDEEEVEEEEELFDEATIAQLRQIAAGIKASPAQAGPVQALVRGMSKKLQAVMAEYGFPA